MILAKRMPIEGKTKPSARLKKMPRKKNVLCLRKYGHSLERVAFGFGFSYCICDLELYCYVLDDFSAFYIGFYATS